MIEPKDCKHTEFTSTVGVARLEDIGRFCAEIQITCAQCLTRMVFLGVPMGMDYNGARVSFGGHELRVGIHPENEPVPVIEGPTGFDIQTPPRNRGDA